MNTYNICVKDREILKNIPAEKLEETLKILKGLVWALGGSNQDIQILENKQNF